MSGRTEKEVKANVQMQARLKTLPSIFSEFYYHMYSTKSYMTLKTYILYVKEFAEFVDGEVISNEFYKQVQPSIINRYFAQMKYIEKDGKYHSISDSIRATKWSALNTFFDFLEKSSYIKSNPVSKTERPKVKDNPNVSYLDEQEMRNLLENIESKAKDRNKNRDLAIIGLGLTTGLRVSALVQINMQDIDFNNNSIRVIEKRGKVCNILFGDKVKEYLLAWVKDRKNNYPKANTDALFVSSRNTRITRDGVDFILKRYSADITNKKVTPHVMRHSCATNLYEKTGDIYLCAAVLNHQNISTTQRYAEMSQEKKKSAANILDGLI